MFDKFGLKDAACGIWKYKIWILVCACIGILISGINEFSKSKNVDEQKNYTIEKQIRFEAVRAPQEHQSVLNSQEYSGGQVGASYMALFETRAFKEYVVESVNSADELISISEVEQYVNVGLLKDNYTFSIVISGPRESILKPILDSCYNYIVECQRTMYGMNEESIKQIGESSIIVTEVTVETNYKKAILVGAIIGLFLSCVIVLFIVLFRPVFNRKNDFRIYGIPVMGEIKLQNSDSAKSEAMKGIKLQIEHICKKHGWKAIGFATSYKCVKFQDEVVEGLRMLGEGECQLVILPKNQMRGSFLGECQKCDAVVLIERYGYSLYEEYEDAIEFLQQNDIEIAGVIACK